MFNLSSVQVVLTLVAMIYDVLILVILYVMNYIMVLIWKLPNISTIQKPYYRSFPVPMASFVDVLRPEK
jgi:hypothetical protein